MAQLHALEGQVGDCEAMRELCVIVKRIAPMPSTVLIQGESGTGKELAARAIHARSGRTGGFVAINCGEMPLAMQAKLLRVLEERCIRPVGGNEQVPVDVRIVAATNRELGDEVAAGRFREDLYYRLNVVALRLPPLRERREDIAPLARHFMAGLSRELGLPVPAWDQWDLDQLTRYDRPGNVRELRNIIERCLLLGRRPGHCLADAGPNGADPSAGPCEPADLTLAAVEKAHILKVLALAEGNQSEAARRLDISRKTLERKLKAWSAALAGG